MCSLLVSLVKASLLNILWQSLAYLQGYPSFFCCLGFLAILIAIVADIAQHIGCFTGIKESVISITILALGTSIPGSTQWANTRKKKILYWDGGGYGNNALVEVSLCTYL
jgi:hypothetical protein